MSVYQTAQRKLKQQRAECIGRMYKALGMAYAVPDAPATRRYDGAYGKVICLARSVSQ